jgi:hypothetical protein
MRLWSYKRNINKHFWRRYWGGIQYLLSAYRLHRIILTRIISLTDLSATLWLFVVVTGRCFVGPESPTVHHSSDKSIRRVTKWIWGWALSSLWMRHARGMGALSWLHDRYSNHRHGRLGIQLGIVLSYPDSRKHRTEATIRVPRKF